MYLPTMDCPWTVRGSGLASCYCWTSYRGCLLVAETIKNLSEILRVCSYAQVTRDGTVSDQHLKTWIDHSAGPPAHKLRSLEVLHKSLPDHLFNVDVVKALQLHHDKPARGRAAGAARGKAQTLAMNLELMDWVLRRQKAEDQPPGTATTGKTAAGASARLTEYRRGTGGRCRCTARAVGSLGPQLSGVVVLTVVVGSVCHTWTATGSSPSPAGRPAPVLTGPALQQKQSSVEEAVSPSWKSAKKAVERPSTPTVPDLTPEEALEPYVLLLQVRRPTLLTTHWSVPVWEADLT